MWQHTREVHDGQIGEDGGVKDYKFHVTESFKDSFTRQVDESVRLSREERGLENTGGDGEYRCLNRKGEYFVARRVQPTFQEM